MGNQTGTERAFGAALARQLGPADRMLANIRITDAQTGDTEIDFVLLLPGFGIATIEVKGGTVSYEAGEWRLDDGRRVRRINPIEQARSGKHALRRYVSRQSGWSHALPTTEWFLAMPNTKVLADVGPEGRYELLIGSNHLEGAVERIKAALAQVNDGGRTIDDSDAHSVECMLAGHTGSESLQPGKVGWLRKWSFAAIAAFGIGFALEFEVANLAVSAIAATLTAGGLFAFYGRNRASHGRRLAAAGLVALSAFGGSTVESVAANQVAAQPCDPNYSPCVAPAKDVDCSDLTFAVTVVGEDVYQLDRDGDGKGCEWNAPRTASPTP